MNWTEWLEPALGALLILVAAGLMFYFSLPRDRRQGRARSRVVLRPIRAMQRLRRAIGLAVEDGSRLHVSIGRASIISPTEAANSRGRRIQCAAMKANTCRLDRTRRRGPSSSYSSLMGKNLGDHIGRGGRGRQICVLRDGRFATSSG